MNARVRECVYDAATAFAVDYSEVMSGSRLKAITSARIAACALLTYRYGWSSKAIGKALGRDHTTVLSALKRARKEPIASIVSELLGRRNLPRKAGWRGPYPNACGQLSGCKGPGWYARCG